MMPVPQQSSNSPANRISLNFFYAFTTKPNTERNNIEARGCLLKLHLNSYFRMPLYTARPAHHYADCLTPPASWMELRTHMVSDSFREVLVWFNITCCGHQIRACVHIKINSALPCSHTHQVYKTVIFGEMESFALRPVGTENQLPVPCQLHISAL